MNSKYISKHIEWWMKQRRITQGSVLTGSDVCLSLRCLILSYPRQKHHASSSSSGRICHTRCPHWSWDPQEPESLWSTTTSWCRFPRSATLPSASTSPPGPLPTKPRTSSCLSWTAAAGACLGLRWGRNASSMLVRSRFSTDTDWVHLLNS